MLREARRQVAQTSVCGVSLASSGRAPCKDQLEPHRLKSVLLKVCATQSLRHKTPHQLPALRAPPSWHYRRDAARLLGGKFLQPNRARRWIDGGDALGGEHFGRGAA